MDRYEGPATLERWANPSTRLAVFAIQVAIESSTESGRSAQAVLPLPLDDGGRDAFEFYMAGSAFFTLRPPGESTTAVAVQLTPDGLHLGPDDRRVPASGPVTFYINGEGRFEAKPD